jgi:hypothetical protein
MIKQALKSAVDWCIRNQVEIPLDLIVEYMNATKDYDYWRDTLRRMIRNLYNGFMGGEFVQILESLIRGQLGQAYERAWLDSGGEMPMPDYLRSAYTNDYYNQIGFIQEFYRNIIDARIEGTSLESLLARADLWANRWTEAYNNAMMLIQVQNGGNMIWRLGEREDHCETCSQLDGIVAWAKEWELTGFHPQGAPNNLLECGGWRCGCSLTPTTQRRSPKVMDTLMNIAVSRGI